MSYCYFVNVEVSSRLMDKGRLSEVYFYTEMVCPNSPSYCHKETLWLSKSNVIMKINTSQMHVEVAGEEWTDWGGGELQLFYHK